MKNIFHSLFTFASLVALLASCNTPVEKNYQEPARNPEETFIGSFVSDGYDERNTGTDWISVSIKQIRNNLYHIEIRSRSDLKKPTCTLTADAHLNRKKELITSQPGLEVGFRISGDILSIYAPSDKDLNYFCSGGATIAGKYKRIPGKPDQKQIDRSQFGKFLEHKNFSFSVQAEQNMLTIQPIAAKKKTGQVIIPFKGTVTNAEIADLNEDGFPEIYVYIREGRDQHIRLDAYNYTDGNFLQKIMDPNNVMEEDPKNFYGRDEFKTDQRRGNLSRLFPIKGTHNLRVIGYAIKTDGAVPEFVYSSISTTNEYPW